MNAAATPDDNAARDRLDDLHTSLDEVFDNLNIPNTPHYLYDPIHTVFENAGKRIRPVLVVLASRLNDAEAMHALPAAAAVQLFHDFSLVHDDIMDNAAERRGRPSIHRQYDTPAAILSGDLLLCLAYEQLGRLENAAVKARVFDLFTAAAIKVCEGQALDAELVETTTASLDEYLQMIDGKTAALLECCLQIGGVIGGLTDDHVGILKTIGNYMGRAFQIQDDLLDITADNSSWGKPVGGDLVEGKKTYPVLKGQDLAGPDEKKWFEEYFSSTGIDYDDVPRARAVLAATGALEETRQEVDRYTELAFDRLNELPGGTARDLLRYLIGRLNSRTH